MAYSLSPNLKLRIDTNLTANAKYNLLKLDELGSLAATSSASGTVQLKSQYDLFLNANDPDQGGTGRGGNILLGSPDSQLDSIVMNAQRIVVNGGFGFFDQSVQNTDQEASSLTISYFSALSGSPDPQDVSLKLDLNNQDREFILGGNLSISGDVQLSAAGTGSSSVQLPPSGILATLSGPEILTNKILDATQNTIQNIGPGNLVSSFLLPGSKVTANFPGQALKAASLTVPAGVKETRIQGAPAQLNDLTLILPASPGLSGQVLTTDGTGSLSWSDKSSIQFAAYSQTPELSAVVSQSSLTGAISLTLDKTPQEPNLVWAGPSLGGAAKPQFRKLNYADISHLVGNSRTVTWLPSQGSELVIQHNWGTRSVIVQIFDNLQYEGLDGPTVSRVDLNTVKITSQLPPPTGGWTVLLQAVL